MNETKTPELPTETGQKVMLKKGVIQQQQKGTPKLIETEEQKFEAEQKRIAEAYALVQQNEQRNQDLKVQCWQEIKDVAAKYGLQIHVSHQPVNIVVDLIALGA